MSSSRTNTEQKSTGAISLKGYLIFYNAASCVAWATVLALVAASFVENAGSYEGAYNSCELTLRIAQTAALMEILHAFLGLVQSPVFTVAVQVASRLYLVWGVLALFPQVRSHWAFTTMTFAWSVTEIVRYSNYALNLQGWRPDWLLWCRYNFFLLLYPMGAFSECILVYRSLPYSDNLIYHYVQIASIFVYVPGFYTMFTYMLRQRKKYLGKGKAKEN